MVGSLMVIIVGVVVAVAGVFLWLKPDVALQTINQIRGVPYRPGDPANRRAGVAVTAFGLVLVAAGISIVA
jgi:hypothetical protein